jgi:hypothetical protein
MKNVIAICGWICAVVLALVIGSDTRTPQALAANGAGIRYVTAAGPPKPVGAILMRSSCRRGRN